MGLIKVTMVSGNEYIFKNPHVNTEADLGDWRKSQCYYREEPQVKKVKEGFFSAEVETEGGGFSDDKWLRKNDGSLVRMKWVECIELVEEEEVNQS